MTTNTDTNLPVYILGKTALGLYLAHKLSGVGENPVIITPPADNEISHQEITIKEENAFKKHKFIYKSAPYTFGKAKLLIITSEVNRLKSELLLVSQRNMATTPCIIFSDDKNTDIAQNIIGQPLIHAWFNGWLTKEDDTITLLGNETNIVLHKNYHNLENCLAALSILNRTGINTNSTEDNNQIYWKHFSTNIICTMLTAKEQQNITQICKNKEKRHLINILAEEISSLALFYHTQLSAEEICKNIYSIPPHYSFNTQKLDSQAISKLNHYYHNLITRITDSKLQLPQLNTLMKEIYLRINPF